MNARRLISRLSVFILSLVAAALLAGCGGGGSGGGVGGTLGGTAATGAPVDGIVYVTDSNGIEVNVPVEVDGSFSISVEGMTPPYLLRVVPNGGGDVLYSFASEKNITVNITPLTTLALHLAHNGDLDALYAAWSANVNALDDGLIEAQQEIINANLATLFDDYTVDATFYDFMNVAFTTDGTGIDGVLDTLDISIDSIGGSHTVLVDGVPFAWVPNIDTSGVNIGDFAIVEGSTWLFTVSDSINNIQFSEQALLSSVPNDLEQFEALSQNDIMAEFQFEGLEISVNITNLTYGVTGSGGVGTVISGNLVGTVRIIGEFEGEVINETVNLNTVFEWERIDSVPA
jgi:hypothetical protein